MDEANPGFRPGTFDLEIEEASDCIDMAIEELLKETEIKTNLSRLRRDENLPVPSSREQAGLIYFDLNSSYLTQEAILTLDKIVLDFNNRPQLKLEALAYTDTRADDNYNLWISERRANRILWYLALKGIDTNRMTGKGYGENNPIVNCTGCTEEQHWLNRRAELKIYE